MNLYTYDLETMLSTFLFAGKFLDRPEVQVFELSRRKNQRAELLSWLSYLQNSNVHMVGFNNLGFDYPIIHDLLLNPHTFDYTKAYQLGQQIIQSNNYGGNNLAHNISMRDRIIPQIDLVKINHFDNANRRTPLKSLQFAMRSENVDDLPYDPHAHLESHQVDRLIEYNIHDVTETEKFLKHNLHLIEMRKELLDTGVLTGDVLNYSDVKIGTEYLVSKIGRTKCFNGPSRPKQTFREVVPFKDVILPKIYYRTESFQAVLDWFKAQVYKVKSEEESPKLQANLAGLDFHFGIGGLHASVESKVFHSDQDYIIKDVDVSGMYPAVAIANDFYPEHLGQDFLKAYRQLQIDRKQYPKGSTMNAVLKLAGNGAFGNSDNPYSPFYDPKYPRAITINGQLQLLQLVESLSLIPGLKIIQGNTDGITAYVPRRLEWLFNLWCDVWEGETGLKLEYVDYKSMWIRDVNNYIALTLKGKVKRKGAYAYPETWEDYTGYWNKDYSCLVVQKLAEQMLVNGYNPEAIIHYGTDAFDFMMRYKTPSGSKVFIGDKECTKTIRYYVSTKGQPMKKVSNPKGEPGEYKRKNGLKDSDFKRISLEVGKGIWDDRIHTKNKSKYEIVTTSIESGWLVKECNKASDFDWSDIDYKYYVEQINKLRIGEANV